jgi:phage terminase large subunit-like protein
MVLSLTWSGTPDRSALKLPIPEWAVDELVAAGIIDPLERIQPPEIITPAPSDDPESPYFVEGATFDVDEVVRVCRALSGLVHIKGRWRGRPLKPAAWQVIYVLGPAFGWRVGGLRIIQKLWVEVPRKNGKTTLATGIGIVLFAADREPGAEVYAAACSRDQAGQVFEPAKAMVQASPALRGKVKALTSLLRFPATGSIFRALSKMGDVAQGLNIHGAIVDEVHEYKRRDLVDAILTGDGAREQPLIVFITTSDNGRTDTIYAELRKEIEDLAAGLVEPAADTFGVVWAAPDELDPFSDEAILAANPNADVSVRMSSLRAKAAKARRSPAFMPTYERLTLNRRRDNQVRAINMEIWERGGEPAWTLPEVRARFRDRECYGGLDLSTTEDFAAWALVFPETMTNDRGHEVEGLIAVPRLWIPRAAVERRKAMRNTLEMWAAAGWITITDGDVIDFARIEDDISADAETFQIKEFAYDPWQAENLRQRLVDGGLTGWKCPQTMNQLAGPTLELERLYQLDLIWHGGNPALAWMASNVVAKPDGNGRWKPEKKLSAEKIDGIVALDMAIAARIRERDKAKPAPATGRAVGDNEALPGGGDFFGDTGRLDL